MRKIYARPTFFSIATARAEGKSLNFQLWRCRRGILKGKIFVGSEYFSDPLRDYAVALKIL